MHASLIRGGEELSSYPADCVVSLERRTLPGETADSVVAEIGGLIAALHPESPAGAPEFEVRVLLERAPFAVDPDDPIVTTLTGATRNRDGRPAPVRGAPFWTDCALLGEAGIPAVLYGAAGDGAHAASEWVDLESLARVAEALRATITEFTGSADQR